MFILMQSFHWIILLSLTGLLILTGYSLLIEHEKDKILRAVVPGMILLGVLILPLISTALLHRHIILMASDLVILLVISVFLLPIGKVKPFIMPEGIQRIDERDVMFSRASFHEDEERYADYYQRNPEKQPIDDLIRSLPGLCNPLTPTYNPIATAVTEGNFQYLYDISQYVEGEKTTTPPRTVDSSEASSLIKEISKYFGAVLVGITELKPYHLYSHRGRRPESYGTEVHLNHKYAIAFAVEMDYTMVKNAPKAPTVVESSQQYIAAATIGMQLSYFIRRYGFEARNHMDGNYLVVAPLVAADAGLGEIGRMGILMTERFGPRVRLGVVTTDMPLQPDKPLSLGLEQFCLYCEKCSRECPSQSIPHGPKSNLNGVTRWQINQETCYTYWSKIGTDCAVCMNSCPYSKPDTLLHKLVRFSLRQSEISRRLFPLLDDYLYGKKPYRNLKPKWLK